MPDGASIEVRHEVSDLYRSYPVRQAVEDSLEPLRQSGIDTVEFSERGSALETVSKSERETFAAPILDEQIVLDQKIQAAYTIVSLAFKSSNKWRLYDGNSAISAIINDKEFLDKVERNMIAFSKDDVLLCDVHLITRRTDSGLRTEYAIERVIEHIPAMQQIPFDIN
jgi:hypothetical protein